MNLMCKTVHQMDNSVHDVQKRFLLAKEQVNEVTFENPFIRHMKERFGHI